MSVKIKEENEIKITWIFSSILACLKHMSIGSHLVSQPKNKLILNSEQLFNATDLSPITFGIILPPNPCGKNSTNSQIYPGTLDENKNSKLRTIKILLD